MMGLTRRSPPQGYNAHRIDTPNSKYATFYSSCLTILDFNWAQQGAYYPSTGLSQIYIKCPGCQVAEAPTATPGTVFFITIPLSLRSPLPVHPSVFPFPVPKIPCGALLALGGARSLVVLDRSL